MKAVIYARYSSDNQREASIEGQIRECTAFAEKNGITVLRHYIDRAISAKTDNRPEFQNMIKDSNKKLFDMIIVWKLDRFARNRYDSARYKAQLKKNGVKVISATEVISDGAEGIILESMLEGFAEYYSVDLSEKVVRGMTDNALKCMFNGGTLPMGYVIDAEQHFQIDPVTAPYILDAFKQYDEGATMKQIRDWLNEQGMKNTRGNPLTFNSVQHLLKNRRYIGEYQYRDILIPDGIPAIVPKDLFDRVQAKMEKNKKAPARHKAEDDYVLTTKLFCGYCGAYLCGESGTSRTGVVHHYYKCVSVKKKRKECHKKPVKKGWIEDLVVSETMKMIMDDDAIEAIVSMLMALQEQDNTNIPLYERQLQETNTKIRNLLNAIQQGILTKSTKESLEELEAAKEELETRLANEQLSKPPKISAEFMTFWLHRFRKLDVTKQSHRKMLIDTFINAIYLYDDKMLITFNYKDGTRKITFSDIQEVSKGDASGSDLDCSPAPDRPACVSVRAFLLSYTGGSHARLRLLIYRREFPIDQYTLLKQYFGHSTFRPGQEEVIGALLSGQDVLSVMPTGAGKSICYQIPALILPGMTLVVSPLISLMEDQVTALTQIGIPAAFLNSSLDPQSYYAVLHNARRGVYKLLYIAPERLTTPDFLDLVAHCKISLLAVDEAHCISQWGQDFRPSYLKITEFVEQLPDRPVIGAFTATATAEVKADIENRLDLQNPLRITTGFDRPNLFFEVEHPNNKEAALRAFLASRPTQSGIVYCATRRGVEDVCDALLRNGISATRYHAGLDDNQRRQNQEDFVFDRVRIMVATNAFGMGIDKSNVSFVVHYNMPKNLENYYQEAGRAGRDGEKAHCLLLFSGGDIQTARFLINNASPNEALTPREREEVRRQELLRLEQMIAYCQTTGCLRTHLLRYFGENPKADCGYCGNCGTETAEQDITIEAQKILSGVARVEKRHPSGLGIQMIIRMLHGSQEQRIFQLGLDKLSTYGILREVDRTQIRAYIDHLISMGYLRLSEDAFSTLRITPLAREVLFGGKRVVYTYKIQGKKTQSMQKSGLSEAEEPLFSALKTLRTRLAQKKNVPAYVIFTNAALTDMAVKQPQTMREFLQVAGVGEAKARQYGEAFLEEIRAWRGQND